MSKLYDNFMAKLKQDQHFQSFRRKADHKKGDFKIEIQLKGGKHKGLSEEMIKVIQNEYAVKYLEQLGLQATQANIDRLLQKAPLSSCEINAIWNNSGWLADSVTIIPNSIENKNFDA